MGITTKKYTFWWENSAPDFTLQPQLPIYADIVIVGAGFAGISTAYWLLRLSKKSRRKALRILVLDEAPYAAFKATGRMNGSIYLGSNRSAQQVVDRVGAKRAEQLYAYSNRNNMLLYDLVDRGLSCDAEFNGGFRMSSSRDEEAELKSSAQLLRDWGYYPAEFSHDQSQHIMVAPNTKGSLFVPGEGMFDPFAFTNKMARLLRKNNVWILYGARVQHSDTSSAHGPQVHLANGHVVTAGKVVHTTPNTVPWDRINEHLVDRREHVLRTEPLSPDLDDMPLPLMPIELNFGLDSIRTQDRSVIMTGGKVGLSKDPELGVTNDSGYNERIVRQLDQSMLYNFPITNHMDVSHTWTYIETETDDGLPLMGEIPDSNGHYVNIGHGRNKFGLAFLGARNIAEKLLRVKMSSPNEFKIFNPKRLTRGE